jgi:hypothetical protein
MAETFTSEGIDLILAIFPKGGTNLTTTHVGLWTTGGSASTTPAFATVLSTYTTIGEAAPTSYARQPVASGSWGATGAGSGAASGGRQTAAGQVSFPAAGAAYATAINGFFLCDLLAHGSEKSIMICNFDDTTAIASLSLGDVVKVTPTYGMLP